MLTAHQHTQHVVYSNLHIQGKLESLMPHVTFTCIPTYHVSLDVRVSVQFNFLFF